MANVWTAGGSLSTARSDPAGFGTQTASVCAGGFDGTNRLSTTEEYNGSAWSAGGNTVVTHRYLGGCGTLTAGLMNGGHNGTDGQSASSEYNGTSWTAGNSMTNARRSHACFGTQTAAAVNGGLQDLVAWRQSTEEYDGTNYALSNPSSVVHVHVGYCGVQTAGLIIGGQNSGSTRIVKVEEYNGTTWSAGGDVSVAIRMLMAFGTQTSAVRAGGEESTGNVTKVESYDGSTWTTENSLSAARALLRASGDSGYGFVFSGDNGGVLAATEEWGPAPPTVVNPTPVTGAFTIPAPTIQLPVTVSPQPVTGAYTIPTPTVLLGTSVSPASVVGTFTVPVHTVVIPVTITVSPVTGTFSIPAPVVSVAGWYFGVEGFPQGATVEYRIKDKNGTIVQDWTSSGVMEDAGVNKSGYSIITPLVDATLQGRIYWRTSDLKYEASETFNFHRYADNMRGTDNALLAADYTAPDNAGIAAIEAETLTHPTLAEIEASTVLAKEATLNSVLSIVTLLKKYVRNKKAIIKDPDGVGSSTKYLIIYDDNGPPNEIIRKALKDPAGADIADIAVGALADEEASSV